MWSKVPKQKGYTTNKDAGSLKESVIYAERLTWLLGQSAVQWEQIFAELSEVA